MAEALGYDITEAESGNVIVTEVPRSVRLNPAGTVHGGLAGEIGGTQAQPQKPVLARSSIPSWPFVSVLPNRVMNG
jgi:hypothetical protein